MVGVTFLDGTGAYRRRPTEVIVCAFSRSYIIPVKKLVQQIDPDVFIIVCDTHEILGEGFKDIVEDEYPWPMPLHDDKLMKRVVLDRSQTSFHPCGTARLSKNIQQGVVDPGLKVHGIKNLRVIDASCIPVIPDCRIQNSVYMIAEKGADAIKRDHSDLYK